MNCLNFNWGRVLLHSKEEKSKKEKTDGKNGIAESGLKIFHKVKVAEILFNFHTSVKVTVKHIPQ